jgi:hypothetical protein
VSRLDAFRRATAERFVPWGARGREFESRRPDQLKLEACRKPSFQSGNVVVTLAPNRRQPPSLCERHPRSLGLRSGIELAVDVTDIGWSSQADGGREMYSALPVATCRALLHRLAEIKSASQLM